MKDRHGEHIFCELPDGTICSLPAWMFQADCLHFSLGRPMVSVTAMAALRDLIGALQKPASGGMATLNQPPKEGEDEATFIVLQQLVEHFFIDFHFSVLLI